MEDLEIRNDADKVAILETQLEFWKDSFCVCEQYLSDKLFIREILSYL